ncbi:hypothetical protein Godav_025979 [Gossypium davidsonii]|uniref:Uncharacterized protein n=1 Tax=Gossypium davidsonii TaxID=34287 RepID=A0A7J8T5J1_GOSDV|nr:hypothetical protein [Gossypium davidsonii]
MLVVGSMMTPEYGEWRSKRINDNIPELNSEGVRPMEEYLQVIPSELEIIKQDFEERNLELERKIERLEEEKMHLRLDADVQKLQEVTTITAIDENYWAGKDFKVVAAGYPRRKKQNRSVGKKVLGDSGAERDFRTTDARNSKYQEELKARIAELERSLALYRSPNSVVELKPSLCKIEEMKKRIKELEYALQSCEHRIEFLEGNEERWKEQHYHS